MNYFKITGFENGEPIEPYGVETYADHPSEVNFTSRCYDVAYYYEPITYDEYIKLIEKEKGGFKNESNKSI